jgi:hypothetical protein
MWILDKNSNQWIQQKEYLNKTTFDIHKQDMESFRLYSKCLSGAVYNRIFSKNKLFNTLKYKKNSNWIDDNPYNTPIGSGNSIHSSEYTDYLTNYGYTEKMYFNYDNVIKNDVNVIEVETAVDSFDITSSYITLTLNNRTIRDGSLILIKGNKTYIPSIPPNSNVNYHTDTDGIFYYNETNGIYKYTGKKLIKQIYDVVKGLIIFTKDFKEYALLNLPNGNYSDLINAEFTESDSYVMKTQIDYSNPYDIIWNKAVIVNDRNFYIGSKGHIYQINTVDSTDDKYLIIPNKYRYDLNDCKFYNGKLYIVGAEGCFLIMDTDTFEIKYTKLNTEFDLRSIDIIDENNIFIVGDNNVIFYSNNTRDFHKIEIPAFKDFSYSGVIYHNYNKVFITGSNGTFIKAERADNKWKLNKKNIIYKSNSVSKIEYATINGIYTSQNNVPFQIGSDTITNYILFYTNNDIYIFDVDTEKYYVLETNDTVTNHNFTSVLSNNVYGEFIAISNGNMYSISADYSSVTLDETISNVIETSFNNLSIGSDYKFITPHNSNDYIIVGGNRNIITTNYNTLSPSDVYQLDFTFKPKMIYLDYDIAAKLYYFDNQGNYTLPTTSFDITQITNDFIVSDHPTFDGWLKYNKESYAEFKYNGTMNEADKTLYNTHFRAYVYNPNPNNDMGRIRIINGNTTINKNDYQSLLPTESAIYINSAGSSANVITAPSNSLKSFIGKKMMVLRIPLSYDYQTGDILYIGNSAVKGLFMINNVIDLAGERYVYIHHNFNRNIINSLMNMPTYEFFNLNLFNDIDNLTDNLNKHRIGTGFEFIFDGNDIHIQSLLNNSTAYYNMAVELNNNSSYTVLLEYNDRMNSFHYFANYSLYEMLNGIHTKYTLNYRFDAFGDILNLTANNGSGLNPNNAWVDSGNPNSNVIKFGANLDVLYNSIWTHTFYDISFYDNGANTHNFDTCLVIKKDISYDINGNIESYNIYFNKPLNVTTGLPISTLSISARNELHQIDSDLNLLNNIQNEVKNRKGVRGEDYNYYLTDLLYKPNTDSYAKILLSDKNIKNDISALIYTDSNYELALNLINKNYINEFTNDSATVNSGKTYLTVLNPNNNIINSVSVLVQIFYTDNGETILIEHYGIFDSGTLTIEINYPLSLSILNNLTATLNVIEIDTLLNVLPVDLYKIDRDGSIGNDTIVYTPYVNINYSQPNTISAMYIEENMPIKSRYIFKDGLGIKDIFDKYTWILEGEVYDGVLGIEEYTETIADIELDKERIVWYGGTWKCGRFFANKAYSGLFMNADLYGENLYSMEIIQSSYDVKLGNIINNHSTNVHNCRIYNTNLNGGSYYNTRTYDTNTKNINFYHGIFNSGNFNGKFMGGIFVNGTFNGIFNSDYRNSYFLDGVFESGDFENGIFYNGLFNNNKGRSRFGTKSSISKPSIWKGGIFNGNSIHSGLNIDVDGTILPSTKHKYTIWETGQFNNGDFYGGVVLNINFKGGTFHSGIVTEIQIINVNIADNTITLNGDFYFNINDKIFIYDNEHGSIYNEMGSINNDASYLITDVIHDIDTTNNRKITHVVLNKDLSSLFSIIPPYNPNYEETNLLAVSFFDNCTIKNAFINNGILGNNSLIESGMFYGVEYGDWGV